jgi:tRNA threonylcarbamoyladenosine biosynthesis protein TsaB
MKILAIECSHYVAGVALRNGNRIVERVNDNWQKTAEAIVPLVASVMKEAGLRPMELDVIAVSAGPGSFTALRIGMSVAKGIAYGAGRPLIPVSTMLSMAVSAFSHTEAAYVVPVIPSRPGEYHYAVYRRSSAAGMPEEVENARCLAVELFARIEPFAGEFVIVGRNIGELARQDDSLAPYCVEASFFTASSLFSLVGAAPVGGFSGALTEAVPDYRQQFVPALKQPSGGS